MGPQLYLIIALVCALPVTYGTMLAKQHIAVNHAYSEGKRVGEETVAATVSKQAASVVAAVSEGEAAAPVVSPEKAAIAALCAKSASCRERVKP